MSFEWLKFETLYLKFISNLKRNYKGQLVIEPV